MEPILTVYVHGVSETLLQYALRKIQSKFRNRTVVGVSEPFKGDLHYYVAYVGKKRVLRRSLEVSQLQAIADYNEGVLAIMTGGVKP